MEKLLLQAPRPSIGFALARELGVVEQILPEMVPLYTCPQDAEWHPEGDVWTHTLMVIDEARRRNADLDRPRLAAVMLGAMCHDLGKPETTIHVDGRVKSPGHEAAGVPHATRLLDRLNVHTLDGFDVRAQVLGLVAEHLRPSAFHKAQDTLTDGAFRRLSQKVDLELLARFARADCHGRAGTFDCSAMDWFIERARALGVEHRPPAPILMGRHLLELGVAPGPRMGEILKAVYELQLDGVVADAGGCRGQGAPAHRPTALAERARQQIGHAHDRRVCPQVPLVEAVSLHADDALDVSPLAVGRLAATAIPAELLKQDVLGWVHMEHPAGAHLDRLAAKQLRGIERRSACHEEVDLQLCCLVNEVGAGLVRHRSAQGRLADVEVLGEKLDEGSDVSLFERGDDVDVDRRSRLTRNRARKGTANRGDDAKAVERPHHEERDRDRVDRRHHRSPSVSISGYAARASSGPSVTRASRRKCSRGVASG
jgi:hypothetical protein